MISMRPSWLATPSMVLRSPERVIPVFLSSFASVFSALARSLTFQSFVDERASPLSAPSSLSAAPSVLSSSPATLSRSCCCCCCCSCFFSAGRRSPAASMSSNKTTQRHGNALNSKLKSSSVSVGSWSEMTWMSSPNIPASAKDNEVLPVPGGP